MMARNIWKKGWGTRVRTGSQVGQVWFWGAAYIPGRLIWKKNKQKKRHLDIYLVLIDTKPFPPHSASPPAGSLWQMEGRCCMCVFTCVCVLCTTEDYLRLLLCLLVYGWVLTEKLRMVCPAETPPSTVQASVDHFNPPHHATRERGDSLSWNLAHSTGWGNQLRPDWQPPYLIPFPCSLLRVLFLLLCRFALAMPPPPPPILLFS